MLTLMIGPRFPSSTVLDQIVREEVLYNGDRSGTS